MTTVRDACQLQPNAMSVKLSDQLEQLDELISAEGEARKPIPSYQICKGTVFELLDEVLDFVMSKAARRVDTRAESTQVPVDYELPREAVVEAIVNADKAGSGTLDIIARCRDAGLAAALFRQDGGHFVQVLQRPAASAPEVTTEVTTEVVPELRRLRALNGEMSRQQLQAALGLKSDEHFRKAYLHWRRSCRAPGRIAASRAVSAGHRGQVVGAVVNPDTRRDGRRQKMKDKRWL